MWRIDDAREPLGEAINRRTRANPPKGPNADYFEFLEFDDSPLQTNRRGVSSIICVQLGESVLDSTLNRLLGSPLTISSVIES